MNKKKILNELEEVTNTISRMASNSTNMFKTKEKGDLDRTFLLGYATGRLKQIVNALKSDLHIKTDKEDSCRK